MPPRNRERGMRNRKQTIEEIRNQLRRALINASGGANHGLLSGLSDDDHSLYLLASDATNRATFAANWIDLTDAGETVLHIHDTRYYTETEIDAIIAGLGGDGLTVSGAVIDIDISPLTAIGTIDSANDLLLIEDATDGSIRKVTADNFSGGSVGLGSSDEIPHMNAGGTAFDYVSGFNLSTPTNILSVPASIRVANNAAINLFLSLHNERSSASDLSIKMETSETANDGDNVVMTFDGGIPHFDITCDDISGTSHPLLTYTYLSNSVAWNSNAFTGVGDLFVSNGNGIVVGHTAQVDFGAIPEFQVLGTATPDSSMGFARFENNASGPDVRFLKSRGASIGANTIVQDGDTLGRFRFQGADGGDFNTTAAEVLAKVDGTPSLNDIPGEIVFRTRTAGGSLSDKVVIDNAGKMGIGTTGPTATLAVIGDIGIGTSETVTISAASGICTIAGSGGTNNENMLIDFESANVIDLSTTTGAATLQISSGFTKVLLEFNKRMAFRSSSNGIRSASTDQLEFTAGNIRFLELLESTTDVLNIDPDATGILTRFGGPNGVDISASTGILTLASLGATNQEAITIDGNSGARIDIGSPGTNFLNILFNDIRIPTRLVHHNDNDTLIRWDLDRIRMEAGGVVFIDMTESTTNTLGLGTSGTIDVSIGSSGSEIGFFGASTALKPAVTGSRGGNTALASLLTALSSLGLLTDNSI